MTTYTYIKFRNGNKVIKKVPDYYFWAVPLLAGLICFLIFGIFLLIYIYHFYELPMQVEQISKPVRYLVGGS